MSARPMPIVLGLTLLLAGCGGDPNKPKLAPVKGTVTYKGQPLDSGTVTFLPTPENPASKGGQISTGAIGSDGSYSMMTFDPGDGALLGDHIVTVQSFGKNAEFGKKDAKGNILYVLPKLVIPAQYAQSDQTLLRFTVKDETNRFDIELKD